MSLLRKQELANARSWFLYFGIIRSILAQVALSRRTFPCEEKSTSFLSTALKQDVKC